ncbi:MAG: HlyD family secretion protein [Gammaproteobacteria bacterium]
MALTLRDILRHGESHQCLLHAFPLGGISISLIMKIIITGWLTNRLSALFRRFTRAAFSKSRQLLSTRRRIVTACVLLIVLAAIGVWIGHWISYRADHVQTEDARIEANVITVTSRYAGWVTSFPLIQGDRPHKDAVIARIYGKDALLRVASLQSKQAALQAQLTSAKAEHTQAKKQTRAELKAAEQSLAAAKADLKGQQAQLVFAKEDAREGSKLVKPGVITLRQEQRRQTAYQQAQANVAESQSKLHKARADVVKARAGLGQVAVLAAQGKAIAAQVQEAETMLKKAKLAVTDRIIKSPVNGVVDKTFVLKGDYVTPGQPLLMMHDPSHVWIEANVKETDIASVAPGDPASIHVDAYSGRTFHGKVVRVGNAATNQFALLPNPNPSGNFVKVTQRIPVRIALEQTKHGRLKPGMNVEVSIDISHNK